MLKQAYDDFGPESNRTGLACMDPSLAVQSSLEETDINTIVRRFGLTGQLPRDVRAPEFGDFTEVVDFKSAMDAIASAQVAFMKMPADVRRRFGNDPQDFVEFCSDDKNLEEMKKLGLVVEADRRMRVEKTRKADFEAEKKALEASKVSDSKK